MAPLPAPRTPPPPPPHVSTIARKTRQRLRCQVRPTPWYDASEFEAVGRGLVRASSLFHCSQGGGEGEYEEAAREVAASVRRVALWRCRSEASGGRLPHAVETTSSLAEALLADRSSSCASSTTTNPTTTTNTTSTLSLRLAYSASIVRAVNGLADSVVKTRVSNQRGGRDRNAANSVQALCGRLGLPDWIVDLRHEASHNDLPPLPPLRLAAELLVRYFGDRYWDVLAEANGEVRDAAVELVGRIEVAAEERVRMIAEAEAKNEELAEEDEPPPDPDPKTEEEEEEEEEDEQEEEEEETAMALPPPPASVSTFNYFSLLAVDPSPSSSSRSKPRKRRRPPRRTPPPPRKKTASELARERREQKAKAVSELENRPASAVTLAREFVKTVPLDVGLNVLMEHFVWGSGAEGNGRGALVPPAEEPAEDGSNALTGKDGDRDGGSGGGGSVSVGFPATEEGANLVRRKYAGVLAEISGAWTGFAHCLLVNIVDCVLSIEEARSERRTAAASGRRVTDAPPPKGDDERSGDAPPTSSPMDGTSGADSGDGESTNEKGGHENGEEDRKLYFLTFWVRYLLSSSLRGASAASLPLNSLADRCLQSVADARSRARAQVQLEGRASSEEEEVPTTGSAVTPAPAHAPRAVAEELLRLFEEALGEERVEWMGLGRQNDTKMGEAKSLQKNKIADGDDEESRDGGIILPDDTATAEVVRADERDVCPPSSSLGWTLCESWDACTIGTLPAYPAR